MRQAPEEIRDDWTFSWLFELEGERHDLVRAGAWG
jgi:hypothetical protein